VSWNERCARRRVPARVRLRNSSGPLRTCRAPLEAAHTVLVGRLHRRPDFGATGALLLVIRAPQQVGHTPGRS
jgi:hypothetical protein